MTQTKLKKKTVSFNRDLETLIICALRYAIPRNTYMPDLIARFIEAHWDDIHPTTQKAIHADIDSFYGESFTHKKPWDRIMALKIDDKNSSSV